MLLHKSGIYLALSALLLSLSYYYPPAAPCIFLFMIPIFCLVISGQDSLSFKEGCLWGMFFFTTHFFGIFYLLYEHAQGSFKFLAGVLLWLNGVVHAGIWFWLAAQLALIKWGNVVWRLSCWIAITLLFFFWLKNFILLPAGCLQGYCFGNPIVVLAANPRFLQLLPYLGEGGLLLCVLLFSACAALAIKQRRLLCWGLCFVFVLPFVYGFCIFFQENPPAYLASCAYASPPDEATHPLDCAQELNEIFDNVLQKNPDARIIFAPETSYPFPLNKHPAMVELWYNNAVPEDVYVCIGSQREEAGKLYNCLYLLLQGRIIKFYDKICRMPFTEYVPLFCKNTPSFKELFLKNKKGFSTGRNSAVFFSPNDLFSFVPSICSDLFFGHIPDHLMHTDAWVVVVKDRWFSCSYMKNLMKFYAIMKAIESKKDLFYIGSYEGIWISNRGNQRIL